MNCSDWEEKIALYSGGDLSSGDAAEVERHVAQCAGCQLLLSGLRESLGLWQQAHAEPVESAHFAAVRARVLSELERARMPWWRHASVYAAVVATIVLVVIAVRPKPPSRNVAVMPVPAMTVSPTTGQTQPQAQVVHQVVTPRNRRPRTKPAVEAEKPAQPLVVKLLTDDPDVIIYWITETKGE